MKVRSRYLVIIIAVILAVSGAATLWLLTRRTPGATAKVYLDGDPVRTVTLSDVDKPFEFDVKSERGTNRIRVEKGRICIADADCPDRLCVNMGWRSDATTPIVCLPHRLVIRIEGGVHAESVDAVIGGAK